MKKEISKGEYFVLDNDSAKNFMLRQEKRLIVIYQK